MIRTAVKKPNVKKEAADLVTYEQPKVEVETNTEVETETPAENTAE